MSIKGITYAGATDPVQASWTYNGRHENLVAGVASSSSAPIVSGEVIITCRDDIKLDVNQAATGASPIFLRGDHVLKLQRNDTISVLRIGAEDVEVTIKFPE